MVNKLSKLYIIHKYWSKYNAFVPFLDTEVKITPEGELKTRYFRKPQDKGIIVNAKSHHLCEERGAEERSAEKQL